MNIELRGITEDNFKECINLSLTEEQQEYIATNKYSLAEAYAYQCDGKYIPMTYVIYNEDTMVGFIFASYQPIDPEDEDDYEDVYYISRLMIDKRYQRNGYGKEAMKRLIEIMKKRTYGSAQAIILSCSRDNMAAYKLYESLGFVDSDKFDEDGDVYLRLEL